MSRRPPNPGADRALQNQQTLKTLTKVESNKNCADCKRNKHPRWASWNLGVFLCIRCSGIHRGMGTHISRVKSVDLDAWTDEQMQSMLRWGNARANKYWESKLAAGHMPAEAKIENFIRTKYESKRWVMDGGMPDPSTLDTEGGDDEVPLNVVQEKAKLDRSASQRGASSFSQPAPPMEKPQQDVDLFGDLPDPSLAQRSSSAAPATSQTAPPRNAPSTNPKTSKTGDSLLGFDFFGPASSNPPSRPSSAAATTAGSAMPSRPDLKQSILSLYASQPKASGQTSGHVRNASSSNTQSAASARGSSSGLDDAFSSLNFSSASAQSPPISSPKSSPFANLASPTSKPAFPAQSASSVRPPSIGGGTFFESKPAPRQKPSNPPTSSSNGMSGGMGGFDDWGDFSAPEPAKSTPAPQSQPSRPKTNSSVNELFDFAAPAPPPARPSIPLAPVQAPQSPFNLSSTKQTETTQPAPQPSSNSSVAKAASMVGPDPWGSSDVWASTNATAQPHVPLKSQPTTSTDFGGWGSNDTEIPAPAVSSASKATAQDDFGGWGSSAPSVNTTTASTTNTAPPKPGGAMGGSDDLFANVWE